MHLYMYSFPLKYLSLNSLNSVNYVLLKAVKSGLSEFMCMYVSKGRTARAVLATGLSAGRGAAFWIDGRGTRMTNYNR